MPKLPQSGGSYIRDPNGDLKRADEATPKPDTKPKADEKVPSPKPKK